jgi:hypothetical protein
MEHNKAPGPDGFPVEFYQVFREVKKDDLLALFSEFHREELNLFSLNFGIITLIPKVLDATKIQQYRLICVLNVSFKIFTKVGTNRLSTVAQKVVSPTQTAFLPGRNIMEGVVILHETNMNYILGSAMGLFLESTLKRHMTRLNGLSFNRHYE